MKNIQKHEIISGIDFLTLQAEFVNIMEETRKTSEAFEHLMENI